MFQIIGSSVLVFFLIVDELILRSVTLALMQNIICKVISDLHSY